MIIWEKTLGDLLDVCVETTNHKGYAFEATIMFNHHYKIVIDREYFYSQNNAIGWCYQESERILKQALKDCINGMENL